MTYRQLFFKLLGMVTRNQEQLPTIKAQKTKNKTVIEPSDWN
jgi:hypothetical protein